MRIIRRVVVPMKLLAWGLQAGNLNHGKEDLEFEGLTVGSRNPAIYRGLDAQDLVMAKSDCRYCYWP